MMQIVLVGLGAGTASALLFASIASGSLLSIVLFYLAPLPIMIAAIGWSHWSAAVAAVAAAIGLAIAFGSIFFFLAFVIGIGLPAWWLGYLALLARTDADGSVEWYPAGRILLWCATIAAALVLIAIPNFGLNEEQFRDGLRAAFERVMQEQGRTTASTPLDVNSDNAKRIVDLLVIIMPLAAAVLATVTNSLNLYLAGRIVSVSGRLRRPWPDLSAIRFPPLAHAAFAASLILSFIPGLIGTIGSIVAAALMMAYGLLGLAVLHAITRATGGRIFILTGTYIAVLFIGWPIVILSLIGVADAIFDFRNRVGSGKPPALTQ